MTMEKISQLNNKETPQRKQLQRNTKWQENPTWIVEKKIGRNAVKLYLVQIHRVTGSEMGRIRTREDADPQPVFGKILNEVPNQVP